MRKTYQYRLYPTKQQEALLEQRLELCRWLFNETLAYRKKKYESDKESISLYATNSLLGQGKRDNPQLKQVYSQVLQNVQERVDLAFQAFFRRVKAGDKPGYPRFRGQGRYTSFTYKQFGFRLDERVLHLSKLGEVPIELHRPLQGQVKTLTLRRHASGKWYACFSVEFEPQPLPPTHEQVGIDVGLKSFAVLSTNESIANPQFFRRDEKDLARVQRRYARTRLAEHQKPIAKVHERIAQRRKNFIHQTSRQIVNRFDLIAIEDIHIESMAHNHHLAKSIYDAAWGEFDHALSYKAAWAGRDLVRINPAHTTQDCSQCGYRQLMSLSDRIYQCPMCRLVRDRDWNASLNILSRGRAALGRPVEAHQL